MFKRIALVWILLAISASLFTATAYGEEPAVNLVAGEPRMETQSSDIKPPTLTGVKVSSTSVTKPGSISVTISFSENGSGLYKYDFRLRHSSQSYSNNAIVYGSGQTSAKQTGKVTCSLDIPAYAREGEWYIEYVNLIDVAENEGHFSEITSPEEAGSDHVGVFTSPRITVNTCNVSQTSIKGIGNALYTGKAVKPKPNVTFGNTTLQLDRDYTVAYENNVNIGTATILIKGKGNYTGSVKRTFKIVCPISKTAISGISNATYTGKAIAPKPKITHLGKTLKLNSDYTVSYKNNIKAGTATVVIKGKGNYTGTVSKTFKINKRSLAAAKVTGITNKLFKGSKVTQSPVVKLDGKTLKNGTDYTLKYSNNARPGTAKLTITGKGNYAGSINKTFKIYQISLAKAKLTGITNKAFNGHAIEQKPTVKLDGKTLKYGTDYTLKYSNNIGPGTSKVSVIGKNSYKGTATKSFKIIKPDVEYRTHVQRQGWQGFVKNDAISGTSGQSLRLEGINIRLSNKPVSGSIQYRTHVQNIGWQDWMKDGQMSGTSGKSLRLEAIQIRLTGDIAKYYDVCYRVHAQHFGWMDWTCNGEKAGTAGYSYRLEAIQIKLVPKGSFEQDPYAQPFRENQFRGNPGAATGAAAAVPTAITTEDTTEDVSYGHVVYITNTGAKYHRDGCRYLKYSKIAIDEDDAIARGYTPCKVCGG